MKTTIDSQARKDISLWRGLLRYFPAALAGVARISKLGNEKYSRDEEMYHADRIVQHMMDAEDLVTVWERTKHGQGSLPMAVDILHEVNQAAWNVLAWSQEFHERFGSVSLLAQFTLGIHCGESGCTQTPLPGLQFCRFHGSIRYQETPPPRCVAPGCTNPPTKGPVAIPANRVRCQIHFVSYDT